MVPGAVFTYTFHNSYQSDAAISAKIGAIDLTPVLQSRMKDLALKVPNGSVMSTPSVGVIVRTISVVYTPEFMARCPTDADRRATLTGLFKQYLEMQLPGSFTETLDVGNPQ